MNEYQMRHSGTVYVAFRLRGRRRSGRWHILPGTWDATMQTPGDARHTICGLAFARHPGWGRIWTTGTVYSGVCAHCLRAQARKAGQA